jgi:hypothetical protein
VTRRTLRVSDIDTLVERAQALGLTVEAVEITVDGAP